jgi:hypothetical protein
MMCPHCGELFYASELRDSLIPTHDFPQPCRAVCPGSKQTPRNSDSDKRPLWKDEQPDTPTH